MKNLLHGFVFLFVIQTFSVQAQGVGDFSYDKIDTIINRSWVAGSWVNLSRSYNSLNPDCSVNAHTSQAWNTNVWENQSRYTYTYFPTKKVNQTTYSNWIDPKWNEFTRSTNTYNAALQLTSVLTEINFNSAWQSQSEVLYTYDANGHVIKELNKHTNGMSLQNSRQRDSKYNASGLVTEERNQNWNGSSWINVDSTSTTYNGMNQEVLSIDFLWKINQWENQSKVTSTYAGELLSVEVEELWKNNAWENNTRSTLTYSAGLPALQTEELWQNNAWVNDSRSTYTYSGGLLSVITSQTWNLNAWINDARYTYNYDDKKRVQSMLLQDWNVISNQWDNSLLSEFYYNSACSALPLSLLNFEAAKSSGAIVLIWATTNEINTSGFDIERSIDGINFQTIGTVTSGGKQTFNHYSYTDKAGNSLNGILYYRLKMIDIDGKFSLSNVEKVNLDLRAKLSVFPNPVRDQLIFVTGENMLNAAASITGQDGRVFLSHKLGNINGSDKNTMEVSTLPAGVYILSIKDNNKVVTQKFIKQ